MSAKNVCFHVYSLIFSVVDTFIYIFLCFYLHMQSFIYFHLNSSTCQNNYNLLLLQYLSEEFCCIIWYWQSDIGVGDCSNLVKSKIAL